MARVWGALGAVLSASCLLTTSLDGLEGPPLVPDAGGGGNDGGVVDGTGAGIDRASSDGAPEGGSSDGATSDDPPILDGNANDGAANGPFVVAVVGGVPRGIAEHDTEIFWVQTDTSTGIAHVSKQGGQPAFFHATTNAFDVAVDNDYVYWSTGTNEVYRKALAGGTGAEVYFSGAGETLYLATSNDGRIYVTGSNVVAVGPRGDAGISDGLYYVQAGAAGLALSGTDLFWSLGAGIVRGFVTGQPPPPLPVYDGAVGEVSGVATDGQDIYWIASDGAVRTMSLTNPGAQVPREVCRARNGTGDAGPDARADGSAGDFASADIAVDNQWVYFSEPAARQISKCRR